MEEEVKEGTTNSRSAGHLVAVASTEALRVDPLPEAAEEAKADSAQQLGSQSNRDQIDDGPTEDAEALHRLEGPDAQQE